MIVVDRYIGGRTRSAELGHERAIIGRKHLHAPIDAVSNEQVTATWFERQALRLIEATILVACVTTDRELDSTIMLDEARFPEHWSTT